MYPTLFRGNDHSNQIFHVCHTYLSRVGLRYSAYIHTSIQSRMSCSFGFVWKNFSWFSCFIGTNYALIVSFSSLSGSFVFSIKGTTFGDLLLMRMLAFFPIGSFPTFVDHMSGHLLWRTVAHALTNFPSKVSILCLAFCVVLSSWKSYDFWSDAEVGNLPLRDVVPHIFAPTSRKSIQMPLFVHFQPPVFKIGTSL